jgi:hypothetical protein
MSELIGLRVGRLERELQRVRIVGAIGLLVMGVLVLLASPTTTVIRERVIASGPRRVK